MGSKEIEKKSDIPAVKIEHLNVSYNRSEVLSDICLSVQDKEYLGIIGPNGGGKTTLLKAVLGLVPYECGSVEVYGEPEKSSAGKIGYVPQFSEVDKQFPITVSEVVLTGMMRGGLSPFFRFSKSDKEKCLSILDRVGIYNLRERRISSLSGGEFQKMLIARALAVEPRLLILDEPTASVDINSRDQIYSLLSKLNSDMTIILVTHDIFAVSSYVKRLACLNKNLIYHGEPELNSDIVTHLYGCPVDIIAHGVPHRVLKQHEGEV